MRVYLDNCCHNRPFDEQSQLRIRLETEARMEVHDYTRWRENYMYIGESVRETATRAKAVASKINGSISFA